MQISTWVSSQKLRLISAAVRVNMQFICIWRLRNQLELEAVLEELSALLPKQELLAMYQEATREPYSFWFIYYLKDKANMFYKRWEERFVVDGDAEPEQPVNGRLPVGGGQQAAGGRAHRRVGVQQHQVLQHQPSAQRVRSSAGDDANRVGPGRVRGVRGQ